jgi:hypothetical protein
MSDDALRLLVLTGPAGRSFAVSELPDSGRFVADDLDESRRLGDLNGDLTPFLVTIQDAPFIVFAGTVLSPGGADRVDITSPGLAGIHQACHVRNHVWMSFPEPFTDGMVITATWREGERVLFERQSEPIRPDALEPIFGPSWTSYAPLD